MATEKTVVEYDASKAIAQIAQLERRILELEGKTKSSFGKMSSASEGLEKGIKGLNAPAGNLVENFRKLASGVTPLGVAIGAAAGSASQLLGEIVELPAALRATEERVKALTDGIERAATIAKAGIKLTASIDAVNIAEQIKAIDLRRADVTEERVEIQEKRDVLKDKLEVEKAYQAQRKAIAKSASQEIAKLEDIATGIRDKRFQRGVAGQDLPRQLDKLLTGAAQLRQAGGEENFQRANRLIDQAAGLAESKGDHRDLERVISEEGRLLTAIDETVKARGEQARVESTVSKDSHSRVAAIEAEIKALTKLFTARRNENKLLAAESIRKRHAEGDVGEVEGQRSAIRDRQAALAQAHARFTSRRSIGEGFADAGRRVLGSPFDLANKALGGQTVVDQQAQVNRAKQLAGGAFGSLQKATPEGNAQAEQFLQQLNQTITKLESGQGVAKALKFDVENLKAGVEFLNKVVEADDKFVESRGSTERFSLGAVNEEADRYAESLERAAAARERLAVPVPGLGLPPVAPNAPSAPAQTPTSLPAAQGPTQGGNTTVNINVKGGIIDPEVGRAIGDEVRRQLRRGTGPGSR